ncbi:MarR family transcriptional regulator [Actinoallomurus sp. NBC_01490]|jgi:DNA-binding MarR family transcriptional regulator|uniref:MarR family winged helix-turn-helix transcriptional regulator n=1 Tax=Actinoallomurus sp. NBC_01490 TaxID=2903557 RepID=UPI002E3360E4|nr:MarR family transcriptional regulator [Actinoallomurus sp. NBC_01490]
MMIPGETIADLEREVAVFVRHEHAASGRLGRETYPDLTAAAYGLLAHLADRGRHRPTEIAEHMGIASPVVSRRLQLLETLGLIERFPVPNDARAYLVGLTDEGRRRVAEVQDVRGRRLEALLASWPEHDVRTLAELLAKFNGSAAGPARHCDATGGDVRG